MPAPKTDAPVLLTGITGFIAKRIAADLLNAGYPVRGTLRTPGRADEVRAALRPHLIEPQASDDRLSFATANLDSEDGWAEAAEGTSALLHTASPFPLAQPKSADDLIRPAVDGTLRALRAAQAAGVTRAVLTSSMVSIMHNDRPKGHAYTEADWTDPDHPTASFYAQSKTLAEKAAWRFVDDHPEMSLTAINPGLVVGRPVDRNYGTSLRVIERFLAGKDPAVPNVGLPIVDLADVSAMHVAALERPDAAGQRYIAADRFVMLPQVARWLADAYPERKIATRVAPGWLLRLLALVDGEVKSVVPQLNDEKVVTGTKAQANLGIRFTPAKEAVLEAAAFIAASDTDKRAA